ncbi:MAG: FtsQ-type POTRA domain-containing protein [Gammaproteobacteria bacterium]|nr:FtsQ-type POTRA domain-containing protein [Gammaproteobacteria bacterium]
MSATSAIVIGGPVRPPESTRLSVRRHRQSLWVVVVAVLLLVLAVDHMLQPGVFPVKRVTFEGEFRYVSPQQLERAMSKQVTGSYFALDLKELEDAARTIPWVNKVSIRRQWPQTLHVKYTEHHLVAHWDKDAWLTHSGKLLHLPGYQGLASLPRLHGPAGSESRLLDRQRRITPVLREVGLKVMSLIQNERGSWVAKLALIDPGTSKLGFKLLLGKEQLDAHLRRFVRVFSASLVEHADRLHTVDLRYPNGFAIAWKAGARPQVAIVNRTFNLNE